MLRLSIAAGFIATLLVSVLSTPALRAGESLAKGALSSHAAR